MKTIKHIEHITSKPQKININLITHSLLSTEKVIIDGRLVPRTSFKLNVSVNKELSVSDFCLENLLELNIKQDPVTLSQSKTAMADNIVDTFQRAEAHYNNNN